MEKLCSYLKGHTNMVQDCDVDSTGTLLTSGVWDNSIKIWSLNEDSEDLDFTEVIGNKKRRVERKIRQKRSLFTFEGHTQAVSGVSFTSSSKEVVSGSWDYSVRFWDVETAGTVTETLRGNKAILSLSYNPILNLVATGHADKAIRIWEKRPKDGEVSRALRSHKAWSTSVQWHPSQEYLLISGSYDNSIKIWDIRSTTPMYSISNAHSDKVLTVSWVNNNILASGSADCLLKCHNVK